MCNTLISTTPVSSSQQPHQSPPFTSKKEEILSSVFKQEDTSSAKGSALIYKFDWEVLTFS